MAQRANDGDGRRRDRGLGESLHSILRSMRTSTPVNKGTSPPQQGGRRLPQIDNPVIVGAIGLGLMGAGAVARTLHPRGRAGRRERFRQRIAEALARRAGDAVELSPENLVVDVEESFGKPALVSVDIRVDPAWVDRASGAESIAPGESRRGDTVDAQGARVLDDVVLPSMLELTARTAWDNPEVAPVAVRGRVTLVTDAQASISPEPDHVERVLADMTLLGFPDEIARPGDLYDRYGAPASDPTWRP